MRSPRLGYFRKIVFRCALLIAGTMVGLLLAEITLRALGLPAFYRSRSRPDQFALVQTSDGYVYHLNTPSTTLRFIYDGNPRGYFDADNGLDHTVNSKGFRGQALPALPKGLHDCRVLFLGDSFTFGEGVRDADTYARKTQDILNGQETPHQRHVECYNLGVGGYNVMDCRFLLEHRTPKGAFECVVLKLDVSDMESRLFESVQTQGKVSIVPHRRWHQQNQDVFATNPPDGGIYRLRVTQLVWKIVNQNRRNRAFLEYYHGLSGSQDWQNGAAALESIGRYCRECHVPLYMVLFPVPPAACAPYPLQEEHDALKALAAKQGKVIDLVPLLASWKPSDTWVHPTDYHPNEKIHALVAEQIAKTLLADGVLEKAHALKEH